MNIQIFSQTYWYIWFLIGLVIVLLLIINGGGIWCFRRKRNRFLQQSNRLNKSVINSAYRRMSNPSSLMENSSFTITTDSGFSCLTKSEELITSTPNSIIIFKENMQPMKKTKVEFQQEALVEHNLIRTEHNKPPLKLTEALNIYAQCWADQCARTNIIIPSRLDWRLHYNGQPLGETILSTKSTNQFDGVQFTRMIIASGEQSKEVHCLLNEVSTEVGFGFASSENEDTTQQQWIGVAHYHPYRQLTTIQS